MRVLPLLALLLALPAQADTLRIGSKRFTESYILGEVLRRAVEGKGPVEHRPGLGNTGIVFAALKAGSIDVYPEYTGTIAKEILKVEGNPSIGDLNAALRSAAPRSRSAARLQQHYALAMREERAQALAIRTLSDLAKNPGLKLGLSQESSAGRRLAGAESGIQNAPTPRLRDSITVSPTKRSPQAGST